MVGFDHKPGFRLGGNTKKEKTRQVCTGKLVESNPHDTVIR